MRINPLSGSFKAMDKKQSSKKTTKKYWLSQAELEAVCSLLSGEAKLIFMLMSSTGQKFSDIVELKWQAFNAKMETLDFGGLNFRIPTAAAEGFLALRENAQSENEVIFKSAYKPVWNRVSRSYFKLGIDQDCGVLKLAKLTFARRHYETYRNKSSLARAMRISTPRWIPKQVFDFQGPCASLVQF